MGAVLHEVDVAREDIEWALPDHMRDAAQPSATSTSAAGAESTTMPRASPPVMDSFLRSWLRPKLSAADSALETVVTDAKRSFQVFGNRLASLGWKLSETASPSASGTKDMVDSPTANLGVQEKTS